MTDQPFNFAIVGSGNIGATYTRALENVSGAGVAALVSRSGNRPDYLPHGTPVFDSIDRIDVPCDAVILCTPNGLHHQGAIEAARRGLHVLTEKVLDISIANMDAMHDACERAGVQLGVTFQRRMSPDNAAVKDLLDQGALGKIYAADMRVKFFRDMDYYNLGDYRGGYAIDGGGPFIQQAAHNLDIFCWFFGLPTEIVAILGTLARDIEAEDHGVAAMRFGDGMIGSITASTIAKPGYSPVLEIHTERGTIIMENDEITAWDIEGVDNPSKKPEDFEIHSGSASAAVTDTSGHEAILADFVQACRGNRPPAVPAASARLATELALNIYQAGGRLEP